MERKIGIFLLSIIIVFSQQSGIAQNYKTIKISKDIELAQISANAYVHISYSEAPGYGRFSSNGLVYTINGKAYLFDTPNDDSQTKELVKYLTDSLKLEIAGFVPNHWHSDCMGGLEYLHSIGVNSYANQLTVDIAKSKNLPVPKNSFRDSLTLTFGEQNINCYYFGAGHTIDNIVVWLPSEKILFAGCMAKELKSTGLGNIVDADLNQWPKTIDLVISKFPDAKIVIPGHGQFGGIELLKHTRDLLTK